MIKGILTVCFCVVLVKTAAEDFKRMKISDKNITAVLILAVLSFCAVPEISIPARIAGAVCVSVPMLLLTLLIPGAFGGGDIKWMAVCGLFLGWRRTSFAVIPAVFSAGVYVIYLLAAGKAGRRSEFPFGPFLCIGIAAAMCMIKQ